MFSYARKAGTADVSVVIRIIDSTDGTPETGVVYNTSGIDLQYRREGATSTAITEATLAGLDSAHSDGGFLHIGNGFYRLDLPDAACAAGSTGVLVHGTVTGMVVIGCYVTLVTYDPFDSVRLGLTALPNAAAEASGGLYTRGTGAGQIAQDANGNIRANVDTIKTQSVTCGAGVTVLASVGTASTSTAQTGDSYAIVNSGTYGASVTKTAVDAIKTKTDYLPSATAGAAGGVFIAGSNAATSVTTALTANITGNLSGSVGSVTGAVGSVTGEVTANVTKISGDATAADNAEAFFDGTGYAGTNNVIPSVTTVTGNVNGSVGSVATGGIVAGSFANDALSANALAAACATKIWASSNATLSISYATLVERVYRFLMNKMNITDATGSVALRNEADGANIATQTISDDDTTTVRTALAWS